MIVDIHTHSWPRTGSSDRLVATSDHGSAGSAVLANDPPLGPDLAPPSAR